MATVNKNRINTPIRNPLTTSNLRAAVTSNKQILMPFPGSNEVMNVGQQIGATVADPFGFKAAVEGYKQDFKNTLPGVLIGGAVLVVGLMLLWAGINAFILPTAGKVVATAAKAVA